MAALGGFGEVAGIGDRQEVANEDEVHI